MSALPASWQLGLEPQSRIRLIVDPESLLIDNAAGIEHSLEAALADFDLPLPENGLADWARVQMPLPQLFSLLLGTDDRQRIGSFFHRFDSHFHTVGRYLGSLRSGSLHLLEQLVADDRFQLHFLSHIGAAATTRLLDIYGLNSFLRTVVTTDEASCPGVRPQLLRSLIEDSALPGSAWMVVSDHPWDLMAAHDLGARCLALAYGRSPLTVLNSLPSEAIATSLADVGNHLLDDAPHPSVVRFAARRAKLH